MNRTRALVVGIERYAAGPTWNLNGAAVDGVRFVEWLLDNGVEPANITFLASALPENMAVLQRVEVQARPADSVTVDTVLRHELREDAADCLIIYWGGHGVVDGGGNRRLYCADATQADKRNLDVTDLLNSLMTTYYPRFSQQLVIVDACQRLTGELRLVHTLPHLTLPTGPAAPERSQHVLFATTPGQVALNDPVNRTGIFTRELLDCLKAGVGLRDWPPDAEPLATELDSRFTSVRQRPFGGQTPSYFWRRTPTRDGLVYSLPPASTESYLTIAQLQCLLDVMTNVPELSSVPPLQAIVALLPNKIRGGVPYSGVPRQDLLSLLRTCDRYATGRAALVGALDTGMSLRDDFDRVMAAIDRCWPTLPW